MANLLMCLIGGWSFILLIGSRFGRNEFKNFYDHIWYTLGLMAALYFVVDSGLSSYQKDLIEKDDRLVQTLELFRAGEKNLEMLCELPEVRDISPALCALASKMDWNLRNYLDFKTVLRARIEPPDWISTLTHDPEVALEITALNTAACGRQERLTQCQKISPELAVSMQDLDSTFVFPPPDYAKAISKIHASMSQTDDRIQQIHRGHNMRYFIFLFVAILAGGKLANASRAMVKYDSISPPSWTLLTVKYLIKKIATLLGLVAMFMGCMRQKISGLFKTLIMRLRRARIVVLARRKRASPERRYAKR
ncbi:hypothetical protein CVS48_17510 [Achromobacter spanius]|nr:hypothetical protein CVS48_17510 [Achromobacter spanius]